MSFLTKYFRGQRKNTANLAKERLQIIISHEHINRHGPDYLPMLKNDLIDVITKYVEIDREQVKVALEQKGEHSVLELNITLPEHTEKKAEAEEAAEA